MRSDAPPVQISSFFFHVIKLAMWGNLGTNMLKTYIALGDQDIDAEFREQMGIKKKEIKEDKKMIP